MSAAGVDPVDIKYIPSGQAHGGHIGNVNPLLQNYTQDTVVVAVEPDAIWIEEQRAAVFNGLARLPSDAGTSLSPEGMRSIRQQQLNERIGRVDKIRVPAFIKMGMKGISAGGTEVIVIMDTGRTPVQLSATVSVKHNGKDHQLMVCSGNDKLKEANQYAISTDSLGQ